MPPGISAVRNQIPFSRQILEEISRAFRRDAQREELSEHKSKRFEAWALAFVSWCASQEPVSCDSGGVRTCRIGEFQVALRGRPEATRREAVEAMDALAFLFGAAEETKATLRSAGLTVENEGGSSEEHVSEEEPPADKRDRSAMNQTFPGWPGKEAESEASLTESSTSNRDPVSRPSSHQDASSTAKAFVRAFHSQIDSMHDPNPGSGEKPKGIMQGAREG